MIETISRVSIVVLYASAIISSLLLLLITEATMSIEDEEEDKILKICKTILKVLLAVYGLSWATLITAAIITLTTI